MIKPNRTLLLLSTGICALSFVMPAVGADTEPYQMGAYDNEPGGRAVLAGDYDAAVEAASRPVLPPDSLSELIAETNLCVAGTVKRNFEMAAKACNEAVSLAALVDMARSHPFRSRSAMVKALSNRGVMEAVSGAYAAAAKDFRAAASLDGDAEEKGVPNRNLAHMEASTGYRLAVAEAARD